jgi:glutamine amidotransferase
MCEHSEENNTPCLNIFPVKVKKFIGNTNDKVPQIGWNTVEKYSSNQENLLFKNIENNSFFYFVHSYYVENSVFTIAKTEYINNFACAIQKDNFFAVQFHPEKSAKIGQTLLENFINF